MMNTIQNLNLWVQVILTFCEANKLMRIVMIQLGGSRCFVFGIVIPSDKSKQLAMGDLEFSDVRIFFLAAFFIQALLSIRCEAVSMIEVS